MTFLPNSYDVPEPPSNFMKLEVGDNRIRILTSPILGYEWWVNVDGVIREKNAKPQKGDKPVRIKMDGTMPADAAETQKHFWAMAVWNYKAKQIQVLQINQSTIQKPLRRYSKDEDWGSPVGVDGYDIVIEREGELLNTEYSVTPKPRMKLDAGIVQAYKDMNVNLDALYNNDDPLAANIDLDEVDKAIS